jgi:hypothetical protein
MSHKSGHIIIQSLKTTPDITPEQISKLEEIEQRDEYTVADRMYLAVLTFQLADD